MNVKENHKATN